MSQGENPARNHRMHSRGERRLLASEQSSLSGRGSWGKACPLPLCGVLVASSGGGGEEGPLGEFQGLSEGTFVKGFCILPGI